MSALEARPLECDPCFRASHFEVIRKTAATIRALGLGRSALARVYYPEADSPEADSPEVVVHRRTRADEARLEDDAAMAAHAADWWRLRSLASLVGRTLSGHAIVWGSLSENLGGFRERIRREALNRNFREGIDVRMLVGHDHRLLLSRQTAGTLTLKTDARGLYVSSTLPDTSYARDTVASVGRGDLTGMSFAFRTVADEWYWEDDMMIRDVLDMRVSEVSAVTFPAYTATDLTVGERALSSGRPRPSRPRRVSMADNYARLMATKPH